MTQPPEPSISDFIADHYRTESRRVFASLVRLLGDFDLAEEALHEAFAAAMERWPQEGVPQNPRSWLVSTGRFKAIDSLRRQGRFLELQSEVALRQHEIEQANAWKTQEAIEDDRLRLIFTCCHPAIDPKVQVPLTLREVCGLSTEEIASAFLTSTTTMAQRIVRGKAKIRDAGIPIVVPSHDELPARLDGVLAVIYLVFSEGYAASSGSSMTRADLSGEAIRLGRLLAQLLPDPEVLGLLALMLFQESRRLARVDDHGDIVLLEDQDRSSWNQEYIQEARQLILSVFRTGQYGPYALQAAIAGEHARATHPQTTDWSQITTLYDALLAINPTAVVELNRAVAIAMRDGPSAGLKLIDAMFDRGDLVNYHLAHAARADLLRRLGSFEEATEAYHAALALTDQAAEQRFLQKRIAEVSGGV